LPPSLSRTQTTNGLSLCAVTYPHRA
jgi:hypothetical protein